jgi:hypothetical protein
MKRPLSGSVLPILFCLCTLQAFSLHVPDSTSAASDSTKAIRGDLSSRKFEGLPPSRIFTEHDPIKASDRELADTILDQRNYAHALLEKVLRDQRFLESLDALSEVELPIGVVKSGGSADYSILIDRIQFTREGAVMDVYASLALPQTGSRIAFHGKVPLSAQGGIAGSAKVYLIGDHFIKFNNNTLLIIKGTQESYVEFDCSGFVGVNLDATLEFSSDLIVPENEEGDREPGRVSVNFTTYTQSLNDILLTLSLPPFQVKGLDGFGFRAARTYLDWSDLSNPSGIVFPAEYTSPLFDA